MPVPLEQFVKQLEDSGVLAGDTLQEFLPPRREPKNAEDLARELVRQKKLTKFQAQEVYRGNGKALVLGSYTILDKIGAGGMGQVFKAEHRRMHRIVAVKMLATSLMSNPAAVARFEREVRAAARLNHPNIVTALDADNANGVHLLIMEYVEGTDLSTLVKKSGPLPIDNAVNYILQTARGLQAAHADGIVHRDIKPANLLLDTNGTVKILDMGLARIGSDAPGQAELTNTGAVMGTVDYMAPEQALSTKSADARADIYSLGCSLYYLLTAKATYDGESLMAKLLAHRDEAIPRIRKLRPAVPESVDAVFGKMVAKRVADRYQTMTEVIADLERLTHGQAPAITRQPVPVSTADDGLTNFLKDISLAASEPVERKKIGPSSWKKNKKNLLIGGGLLAGLIVLAGIVSSFSSKAGTLVVTVNEPDAEVQVLSEEGKVEITRQVEKGSITIPVGPGKHRLHVTKDGFEDFAEEFEIESGGKKPITAKLTPVAKPAVAAAKQGWQGWPGDAPSPAIAPFTADEARKHQQEWAKYLKLPVERTNSIGMKFVLIPPGEFTMGSTRAEREDALALAGTDQHRQACIRSEAPQHKVVLKDPVYLGVHEVSQKDYEAVMGNNPSYFARTGTDAELVKKVADLNTAKHPVEGVSSYDAAEFCAKLSLREDLKPFYRRDGDTMTLLDGTGYRLPAESEWEFACRAGTATRFWIGDRPEDLVRAGWIETNSGARTHPVGEREANPLGLFDLYGNVWEWVQDWWEPGPDGQFFESTASDAGGPASAGSQRVLRGGSWLEPASVSRSSARFASDATRRTSGIGFRVVLAEAGAARDRARWEQQLAAEPDNESAASRLADVLLPRGNNWTVLKPAEMQSDAGATLELQNDGSVFVNQQPTTRKDIYTLVLPTELKGIRGLRLEALADSRLPRGGPGWAVSGNFALTELTLHVAPAAGLVGARSVSLRNAAADFSQPARHVGEAIDGISSTGWSVAPQINKDHTAVFELAEDAGDGVGDGRPLHLTVRLLHQHAEPNCTLGRFRLSVTADPDTLDRDRKRLAPMRITDPWARLAAAYHLLGDQPALDRLLKHHPSAVGGLGDLFAGNLDWERAIAVYSRGITPQTTDADLFAKRAEAYEKLQLWEEASADWGRVDELVADKTTRFEGRYSRIRRAELYDRLRQFDKALADYNRIVETSNAGLEPLNWRSSHWAQRAQWKQAAADFRQLWNKRDRNWNARWTTSRARALLNLLAGDVDGYRLAAAELLAQTEKLTDGDSSKWLVTVLIAAPDLINDASSDRLIAACDRLDNHWKPRLKGALLCRRGEFQQAATLFDQNSGGAPMFQFLAAIAHQQLQHADRARQLFEQGNTWIQEQRDNDPSAGSSVPRKLNWLDWAVYLALQREAARSVQGAELTDLDARLKTNPADATARLNRARVLARIGLYDEALDDLSQADSPASLALRGRVLASLNRDDEALADLNQAIAAQSTDALVYAARGRIHRDRGATEPARADLEKSLNVEPSEQAARVLADLLLADTTGWTLLTPTEMKSEGGARLKLLPDGSILAGGKNPERDTYSLATTTDLTHIRAIRLEALPDPSLPANGPGRNANGNFHLNEFRMTPGATPGTMPATLTGVFVTADEYDQSRLMVDGKIDANCWSIYPQTGRAQTAFFSTDFPRARGDALNVEMYFARGAYTNIALGRFRLSVSDDPAILEQEWKRVLEMKIADPWLRLAAAYAASDRHELAVQTFTAALQRADDYAARKSIVELAARFDKVSSALSKQQPQDQQWQMAQARRLAERGKQRLANHQAAAAQVDLEKSREIFDRLSTFAAQSNWTVLTPTEMKSAIGARLELRKDGSVYVHPHQPVANDTYTLVVPSTIKGAVGLRLEALADTHLPGGGPGWASAGNFILSELTLNVAPSAKPTSARAIVLRNALADFNQFTTANYDVRGAVDGSGATGWAIYPEVNKDHTAVFDLAEPLADSQPSQLTIRLSNQSGYRDHNLGCFRLSMTSDAATLQASRIRLDLKDSEVLEVSIALATAYAAQGNTKAAIATFAAAIPLAADSAGQGRLIAGAAPLEGVLEQLAERAAGDSRFQTELAGYFAIQGNVSAAQTARTKARGLIEASLAQEPENSVAAGDLADVLLPPTEAQTKVIAPTGEKEDVAWRFSTTQPPDGWMGEKFDDSTWPTAPGGFGGNGSAPGFVWKTLWTAKNIWLRRTFEWKPDPDVRTLLLRIIHDDGFELFINGQPVLSRTEHTSGLYVFYPLNARVLSLLKPGTNTLAVHCSSISGPQFIDVGIHGSPTDPRFLRPGFAAMKRADPWMKLAVAYHITDDQPALDRLLQAHPTAAPGIGDLYAADQDWERAIAQYSQALTLSPAADTVLAKRAAAYEATGRWNLAVADWREAARVQPGLAHTACDRFMRAGRWSEASQLGLLRIEQKPEDSDAWLHIAPVLVLAGDGADYSGYCRRMARQFAASQNPYDQERLIKACLLKSNSLDLVKQPGSKLASFLDGRTETGTLHQYAWATRALFAYRSGDFASAVKYVARSRELNPRDSVQALNLAVLAMAQHQLKHPDEARRALEEAAQITTRVEADPNNKTNHDVLIAKILFHEAEALLNGKTKR